jgi:hypothetical protein
LLFLIALLLPTLFPFAWRSTVSRRSLVLGFFVPGGYIPTLETKQRECWKFKTRGVNSEFDSRVSVRPSKTLGTLTRQTRERNTREVHSFQALIINFGSLRQRDECSGISCGWKAREKERYTMNVATVNNLVVVAHRVSLSSLLVAN